jgi:cyclophilin family peptidyl-prolyl cis-trans isomerase
VSYCRKRIAPCLAIGLALLAGCNRGGDGSQTPTASINGSAPTLGGGSPSLHKPNFDPKHPVVVIETSLGNMTVRLDAATAPLSVDNFLAYANTGHYNQTIIHQVYKGQGFVAGAYGTNLVERPGRTPIRNEADNGVKNRRGTIAMTRVPDAIDSATCQFFINVADNPALDHRDRTPEGYGYCVFGEVTEGLEVADKIAAVEVHDAPQFERTPVQPIVVKSVRQTR